MYLPEIYSGEYDHAIICDECGGLLLGISPIFQDFWGRGKFCSKDCKWINSYRQACANHGVRPVSPAGAWRWACSEAWKRSAPYCQGCGKIIGEAAKFNFRGTWIYYWRENGLEYHHRKPIYLGGNSLPENIDVRSLDCHANRHARMPLKGMTQKGRRRSEGQQTFTS
jgi:hypothetical protein